MAAILNSSYDISSEALDLLVVGGGNAALCAAMIAQEALTLMTEAKNRRAAPGIKQQLMP